MKIKLLLFFVGIISVIFYFLLFYKYSKDVQNLGKVTSRLTTSVSFKDYITDSKSHYDKRKDLITVKLTVKDSFDHLTEIEQFGILEYYNKQLRYFMHQGLFESSLYKSNIIIETQTVKNVYRLQNTLLHKNSWATGESILFKNNDKLFTTAKFKHMYKKHIVNNPQIAQEKEILAYATKFYKMLTRSGKYFYPKRDAPIILKAVEDKYALTPKEFDKIYKKHFLGIPDASF